MHYDSQEKKKESERAAGIAKTQSWNCRDTFFNFNNLLIRNFLDRYVHLG